VGTLTWVPAAAAFPRRAQLVRGPSLCLSAVAIIFFQFLPCYFQKTFLTFLADETSKQGFIALNDRNFGLCDLNGKPRRDQLHVVSQPARIKAKNFLPGKEGRSGKSFGNNSEGIKKKRWRPLTGSRKGHALAAHVEKVQQLLLPRPHGPLEDAFFPNFYNKLASAQWSRGVVPCLIFKIFFKVWILINFDKSELSRQPRNQ
jgi:hypothetical protein